MSNVELNELEASLKDAEKNNNEWNKMIISKEIGDFYQSTGNFKKSLTFYETAQKLTKKIPNLRIVLELHLSIGNIYSSQGDFKTAIKEYDNGVSLADKIQHMTYKAEFLYKKGINLLSIEDFTLSVECLNEALSIFDILNNKIAKACVFNAIGTSFLQKDEFDEAEIWFNNCIDMNNIEYVKPIVARAYNNLGLLYYKKNDLISSFSNFGNALAIDTEIDNSTGKAIDLNNIALIYRIKDEKEASIDALNQSIELVDSVQHNDLYETISHNIKEVNQKKWNEKSVKKVIFKTHTLNLIDIVNQKAKILMEYADHMYSCNDIESSVDKYNEILKLCEPLGDCEEIALCLYMIGKIFYEQGVLKKSLQWANEARKKTASVFLKPRIFELIGNLYQQLRDYNSALSAYGAMIKYANEYGDLEGQANGLVKNAELLVLNKDFAKANNYLETALGLFSKIGNISGEIMVYEKMAQNYDGMGDRKTALKYKLKVDQLVKMIK